MSVLKMTHSLLSSWMYATGEDATEERYESFLSDLRREERPKSEAMEQGIAFEDAINQYVKTGALPEASSKTEEDLRDAVQCIGKVCTGGQPQVRMEEKVKIDGTDFLLVGVADYIKAGVIYDIKRVQRYEYGKYQFSTQHPMYFELCPESIKFVYLIFNGSEVFKETYRKTDCEPIQSVVGRFMRYLSDTKLNRLYEENWRVN